MSISVIVPVWNGCALLERLFATLAKQTEQPLEIIAVNNASTDGADDLARRHGARVIEMGRNAGFAAAVNAGIGQSRGEWIAVLNSDVELTPGYLAALRSTATARNAWFATGKLLSADSADLVDGTFDCLCRGGAAWRAGSGRLDGAAFSEPRTIYSPPWTAALFRAELFRRIGVLDEDFGSYLEDVDFGVRCAMNGLSGVYEPAALAWHRGSAALGRWAAETVRLISRNQVLLLAKHCPGPLLRRNAWAILVAQIAWGAIALRHGAVIPWAVGKWQGIRRFSTTRVGQNPWPVERIRLFLVENETVIQDIQRQTGFDLYWRMYFLLTSCEAK